MRAAKNPKSKPKRPRERQEGKPEAGVALNQATTADFEEEGMGIAPKE